jgi:predicted site-specific integrase-resolvase
MLRTRDIADKINVHPETIKRWIKQGKVPAPNRDRNGWYVFDDQDVKNITEYANKIHIPEHKQPGLWQTQSDTTVNQLKQ